MTLLLAALWGGTPVSVKYSLDVLPVMTVAGLRFAMAALFMLLWCRWEGSGLIPRAGQWRPSLTLGTLLFVQIGLFNWAIALSNASHSSLLINTFIFWVVALEHFVTRTDRLTLRKTAGLTIAALGVGLILLTTENSAAKQTADTTTAASFWGDLVMIGSALVLGIKIIYTKQAMQVVEPGKLVFWHDVIGVLFFALWSAATEWPLLVGNPHLPAFFSTAMFTHPLYRNAWLGLLYQGVVVAGFCFAVQALLLRRHSASRLSVFSFATPLFGVTFAVLLRGEGLSGWLLVAGLAVAAGILLVNWPERKETGANWLSSGERR